MLGQRRNAPAFGLFLNEVGVPAVTLLIANDFRSGEFMRIASTDGDSSNLLLVVCCSQEVSAER